MGFPLNSTANAPPFKAVLCWKELLKMEDMLLGLILLVLLSILPTWDYFAFKALEMNKNPPPFYPPELLLKEEVFKWSLIELKTTDPTLQLLQDK